MEMSLVRADAVIPERPVGASDPMGTDGKRRVVRRPVAVIDLSNDQAVRDVANKLLELLASHTELAPPAISDGAALVDKPPADDEMRIASAQKKRLSAELNLAQRSFREAAIDAVEGQELLLRVTPRDAIALYADLALALGQSRLGEKKDAEAREAFALVYRLDPRRTLDDLHYLPEVVQAFEAAKQTPPGQGTIAVRGAGRVWIDGDEVGAAPGEFKVVLGRHVVWLTGPLRETEGKEVLVTETRRGDATIMDGTLTRPQKVVRFRLALAQAQDPAARAIAMTALATFVNVHDAVLLSAVNGKIIWQTWRDRAPGFSALKELGHDTPIEILKQLAPPPPDSDPEPPPVHLPVVEKRWYQRPRVQLGVVATLVVAIIGGYLWAHHTESPRPWDPTIKPFPNGVR
ncbi:MAG TPA: hypothetical protein VHN14_23920 [Kofleriaceae bacterium]|jgi:hypothetical protein|nr:hypothetical protein [Kofleriaceae bacterium]